MRLLPRTPRGAVVTAVFVWLAGAVALWPLIPPLPRAVIAPGFHPVGFAPDGQTFLTATPDGDVVAHDADDGRERSRFSVGRPLQWPPALSADGRLLAWTTSSDTPCQVIVWDIAAGRERAVLPDSGGEPMFSPDSRYLAVASTPRLGFVRVWDLAADPPTARDLRVNGTVSSFSPDGRYLASMDAGAGPATHPLSDASITWWTTDGWQKAGNLTIGRDENNYRLDAMFAADGRLAVYSGDPLRVFLIDPATSERWDLPLPAQGCTFQRTMSSRRGLLAVSCDPPRDSVWQRFCDRVERWGLSIPWGRDAWGVHLIQLDTGREYGCIPGASASLSHWSPDGRLLAVKAVNGAIALWDVPPRPSVLLWEAAALTIAIPVAGFAVWRVRRLRQPVRGTV